MKATGAREGRFTPLRRLVARAMAANLSAFVVPGEDLLRLQGLDLEAVGLRVTATPRHASVLVVTGELSPNLLAAAGVIYAQMLRPRLILAINSGWSQLLPAPDVSITSEQAELEAGVKQLRQLLADGGWLEAVEDFNLPKSIDHAEEKEEKEGQTKEHAQMSHHTGHTMPMISTAPTGHEMHDSMGTEVATSSLDQIYPIPMKAGEPDQEKQSDNIAQAAHSTTQPTVIHDDAATMDMADHSGHVMMNMDAQNTYEVMSIGDTGQDAVTVDNTDNSPTMDHPMTDMGHNMMNMASMDHSGHDTMNMDMSHGGSFMSMVEMTKDLPRSRDGLPMEWAEVPYGPFFRGLNPGLGLMFTLDGEAIARTKLQPGVPGRGLSGSWHDPLRGLPDRLADLNPLTPVAYRLLAYRAVEEISGLPVSSATAKGRIGLLERERVLNHLNWLTNLAILLGDRHLEHASTTFELALARTTRLAQVAKLGDRARKLVRQWQTTPLLKTRLKGKGRLSVEQTVGLGGPIARASNHREDVRQHEAAYTGVGFKPVMVRGGDIQARLEVRLLELQTSFELIAVASAVISDGDGTGEQVWNIGPAELNGTGRARIETPRGPAYLELTLEANHVTDLKLDTPSARLARLVGPVSEGQDLVDGLLGIASLDLSAWELEL